MYVIWYAYVRCDLLRHIKHVQGGGHYTCNNTIHIHLSDRVYTMLPYSNTNKKCEDTLQRIVIIRIAPVHVTVDTFVCTIYCLLFFFW